MTPHRLKIVSTPGEIATGYNTNIFLDGVPLNGVTAVSVYATFGKEVEVKITMNAEIDGIELETYPVFTRGNSDGDTAKT